MTGHRGNQLLTGGSPTVNATMARRGLLPVAPTPPKTTSRMRLRTPLGPCVFWGKPGETRNSNESHTGKWFSGFGGMYWTVGAVREGDVLDYLRWVRGSCNLMPRLTGPIAKHGPPGAAAKKRRALARWPPKSWFGGLWGGLKHPIVKHEAPKRGALETDPLGAF